MKMSCKHDARLAASTPGSVFEKRYIMRKLTSFLLFILVMLCLPFQVGKAQQETETEVESYRIAIASDLHIDPENHYAGVVNPAVMYNVELIDAMLWDVANQDVDLLLLTGDISNAGWEMQHEILAEKLRLAEAQGLQVCVLPGNHDIGDAEGAAFFADVYDEFGFREAYSKDQDSLSYSMLKDNLLVLMLDTDGYTKRTNGAYVSKATLRWIRSQLELSKQNGWKVLAAGHYPLLAAHTTTFTGREELIETLETYKVPMYVCGHMHQRSVADDGLLAELVVEQLTSYPCGYALLEIEDDQYQYQPHKADVDTWAEVTGQTSEDLLDFAAYGARIMQEKSLELINILKEGHDLTEEEEKQATEFYQILMGSFSCGDLYEHLDELKNHPGYPVFMDISVGSNYDKWLPVILENVQPYTTGFVVKENHISLP